MMEINYEILFRVSFCEVFWKIDFLGLACQDFGAYGWDHESRNPSNVNTRDFVKNSSEKPD